MKFTDAFKLSGVRITADGYLVADARVARTGIQIYAGHEVDRPDLDRVRVYRSPKEVFARDSLSTYAYRPITNDHPSESVGAHNWRDLAVGHSSGDIARDGDSVRVPMMLCDAAAIRDVRDGKRELSGGYTCDLDWTAGVDIETGEAYDAAQTSIRMNHVAVVKKGRAGGDYRIGDEEDEDMDVDDVRAVAQKEKRKLRRALKSKGRQRSGKGPAQETEVQRSERERPKRMRNASTGKSRSSRGSALQSSRRNAVHPRRDEAFFYVDLDGYDVEAMGEAQFDEFVGDLVEAAMDEDPEVASAAQDVLDGLTGAHGEMEDRMGLKTVLVDGIPVDTTDAGATVIETLQTRLKDALAAVTAKNTEISTKDADLGKKDAEIVALKGAQVGGAQLDALVRDRAVVVAAARAVAPELVVDGLSSTDLKRAAVSAKLGIEKVKDKSDDYVSALFDGLSAGADPVRDAFGGGNQLRFVDAQSQRDTAHDEYVRNLTNGWMGDRAPAADGKVVR